MKLLLLITTCVQHAHHASLSPTLGSGGHCDTEQKEAATEFTVTRREHEFILYHKRGLPEVAVLRLQLLSGAIE